MTSVQYQGWGSKRVSILVVETEFVEQDRADSVGMHMSFVACLGSAETLFVFCRPIEFVTATEAVQRRSCSQDVEATRFWKA